MNPETIMDCASRIKFERQKRSWTQEQLAERAKLSTRTVQRIECGAESAPETLRLIAEAFGVSVENLRPAPTRIHFRAPWNLTVKIITTLVLTLALALPYFISAAFVRWILWGVVLFSLCFCVSGFSIKNGRLLIHRLGWATKFDLAQLSGYEVNPHALMGAIRVFGNGGIFAFIGYYRNAVVGSFRAFVTDPDKSVVLEFGSKRIVVSPDDPNAFVEALREVTRGVCANPDASNSTN